MNSTMILQGNIKYADIKTAHRHEKRSLQDRAFDADGLFCHNSIYFFSVSKNTLIRRNASFTFSNELA